jgi:hypothetical protein
MQELVREIPDVDTLLALEPEELGAKLLFLIRKRKEKKFHPGKRSSRRGSRPFIRGSNSILQESRLSS